jgi:hypothetical protein
MARKVALSTRGLFVMADYTSPEDQAFFAAIGRLAISWAEIELGLDCAIDIIHPVLGGQKITAAAPRTALSRKIEYIRTWAKTVPEPTFRESALKLMTDIETSSETRHDLIHGIIIEQVEGSGEARMVRLVQSAKSVTKKILFGHYRANPRSRCSCQQNSYSLPAHGDRPARPYPCSREDCR